MACICMLEQLFMWLLSSSNKDCYGRIFFTPLIDLKDYQWNIGWELDDHGYFHEDIFWCLLPSLGKLLLSTLLLLNHIVLHVLLCYLTHLHKDPCISLFLDAKLTNSSARQTATCMGLRYLVKLKLQLTQTRHVTRAQNSFKKQNRSNGYLKPQYNHFWFVFCLFSLLSSKTECGRQKIPTTLP